ncbi:LexA family transcriptional regulator [Pasteurella multocida]|uniref:LexA family transcriptional regulator n=1 Tax=Pasteurella multocida TaxID=747 RepID=UPI00403E0DFF|nr:LexA family transcriptional repressor [Pasteurella multocida]
MKKQWNEFVRDRMSEKNLKQEDIAEAIERTQGAVGHWLTGRRSPNFIEVAKMLNATGADQVILNSDGTIEDIEFIGIPKKGLVKVIGEATMGTDGSVDIEEVHVGYIDIFTTDPKAFCLRVKGSSMEPRIHSGEFVLVEPQSPFSNGDDVFIRTKDGKNMIKILDYQKDGEYRFSSINNDHKPFNLAIDEVELVYYVAGILKKSRFVDLEP